MNDLRTIDAGSFRSVYDQFHARIFRYFLKRAAVHETATELTQQLFIRLWQHRNTLSEQHPLEVQLFTMANSVWIDHLRKLATNKKYFSSVEEFDLPDTTVSTSLQIEASNYFRLAMDKLPPIRKKVFVLKMMHGFSNQEIAGKLSVSVKTVEDHLWKAMRFIRAMITTIWSIIVLLILS
ncbi:RNA polymerase sigma factor [Pseudobacter ginsenosidimutans]|jgi:RNA polymerase sigma-70 factor (ECF subfamily)|uniref:RNA polymerase RpoE-like sigma-24 subunit n=1 Tax=Pseudobacter ginsenosidimutans TaxID=661488 RepID=A0A4Q7N598_9BACT|nr:sigma-70 family RNA polymerase sigma factor [Pseudobacter ginsenosidimutans]QEC44718.1 sigma-70 family RNA polymerase sigma factor [Pseudobacter ginsenosidimutans]RZS76199.1 RNA polymerase RpoE-like sigma-24 subunit [Pseudobacter ginsenosidimutans]